MANFKGFKQVIAQEGMTFENGYLYFVRTNEDKKDGYLYFNGKKYGTAEDVKAELLGSITENDAKTFEAVNLAINELAETIGDDTKGLVKEIATLRADMESLSGGEGSISTQINNAIQALNLPNTYEEKGAAASAETAAKAYADGLATNYDAAGAAETAETAAKAYTDELANGAVKTNTEAIATLNGTGEGSIDKKVADAIAEVVANAPENLDTLKEIADYIASDPQGVAELSNKVTTLEGKAHTHDNKEVIDGITATKVAAWDGAEAAAKAYADGLATNYDAAGAAASAETAAKAYADGLATNYDAAGAAEAAETSAKAYADGLAANYDAAGTAATAETNAKAHADGLNTAMNTRVEELEGDSHEHTNKSELDLIQSGDVAKWNAAITVDGDDVD
jgi:antitoxin component YwqK of YwqJK toxin-antitoxin module